MYIDGTGHNNIAAYLNENNLGGKKWNYATVRSMLLNETYSGKGRYGDIDVKYPVIVSKKVFDKAQRIRKGKGRTGKRSHSLLLGEVMKCGVCGNRYAPQIRKRFDYYTCSTRYLSDTEKCGNGYVRGDYIDKIIFDRVILGGSLYERVREAYESGGTSRRKKELENRIEYLKGRIRNIEAQQQRNYEAYTKGIANLEQFQSQQQRIEKEVSKWEAEMDRAGDELEKLIDNARTLLQIKKDLSNYEQHSGEKRKEDLGVAIAAKRMNRLLIESGMTVKEKQALVKKYIKSIEVHSAKQSNEPIILDIVFDLPIPDKRIRVESRYYLYEDGGRCYGVRPLGKYPKNVINRIRRQGHFLQGHTFKTALAEYLEGMAIW